MFRSQELVLTSFALYAQTVLLSAQAYFMSCWRDANQERASIVLGSFMLALFSLALAPIIDLRCIATAPAGNWLVFYKKKLSVRIRLVGKPKGIPLKALRERCEQLLSHPSTRADGAVLNAYQDKCLTAKKWRGGVLLNNMTDHQVMVDLEMPMSEGCVLPADICQALVFRTMQKLTTAQNWAECLRTVLPMALDGSSHENPTPKSPFMHTCMRCLVFSSGRKQLSSQS